MDKYTAGDYLSDSFGIYKIVDVKEGKDFKGSECVMVRYRPVWKQGKVYEGQIPLNNLGKTGFRKVLKMADVEKIMVQINEKETGWNYDYNAAKESVYQNDPVKIMIILKYLWLNRATPNRGDKDLMEKIIDNLTREISFVSKIKYGEVKSKLIKQLNKID